MLQSIISHVAEILAVPATIGHERPLFRWLATMLNAFEHTKVREYDNLLAVTCGTGEGPVYAAHLDRHGLVCIAEDEFEYAAHQLRYHDSNPASARSETPNMLEKIADRFLHQPVRAYEPWSGETLAQGRITQSRLSKRMNTLVFGIETDDAVPVGAPLAYDTPVEVTDTTIAGQIDNALCVALLSCLCQQGFNGTALFTAEEEAGRSWRYLLDWYLRQQKLGTQGIGPLYVIDTSPFPHEDDRAAQQIVLRRQDEHAIFCEQQTLALEQACRDIGLTYRYKDDFIAEMNAQRAEGEPEKRLGSTELGRLITASDGQLAGTTIQIGTTGYHTAYETAQLDHIMPLYQLLQHLATKEAA